MSFFPLDRDILTSSLWAEPAHVLKVFLYFLLSADAAGNVRDTLPALALRCGLPIEAARAAVDVLCGPDASSRSKRKGGRRVVRNAHGWRVVNFEAHRNKDFSTPRWRRWRDRQLSNGRQRSNTVDNEGKREKGKGTREGGEVPPPTAPPAPPRFPLHCPDHAEVEFPPKCGACKERREASEARDFAGSGTLASDALRTTPPAPRLRVCDACGHRCMSDGTCPFCKMQREDDAQASRSEGA